jgi:penicillin amidase
MGHFSHTIVRSMRRLKPIGSRIAALVITLALVLAIGAAVFVRRSWPETQGTVQLPGLHAMVEVVRDVHGVPTIYAQSLGDMFFAQGYVHAQDRLWQMDMQRRIGLGRLSEILGEPTLETDLLFRTIGTNRSAQQDLAHLTPDDRTALQHYADGVNAYIAQHRDRLPLEYSVLNIQPERWEPLHTLAWIKVMQLNLSSSWSDDLLRARLADSIGSERLSELMPSYPVDAPTVIPAESVSVGSPSVERATQALAILNVPLDGAAIGLGSNGWVVGPERTVSGRPLLANDPHLQFGIPAIWYMMKLHAPGYTTTGATMPGTIGVVIGHNEQLAWGMTNLPADVQDLYIERLDPQNADAYAVDGTYRLFEIVPETVYVKGRSSPLIRNIKIGRHGPLLNDVVDGLEQPLALKWQPATRPSTLVAAIMRMNQARTWSEFQDGLRLWDAPMQHVVFADRDGNIGYYSAGHAPIRDKPFGATPIPGWTSAYEWNGTIPFEDLPHTLNPPDGLIVTANNKPINDQYPYYLDGAWASPNRANRIIDHLTSKQYLSVDDMVAAQADDLSIVAQQLVPLVLEIPVDGATATAAQQALATWNFRLDSDAVGAGIFEVFYLQLVRQIVQDELGTDLSNHYVGRSSKALFVAGLLHDPDNLWWDNTATPDRENRDATIAAAFEQTVAWWQRQHGESVDQWTWGRIHTTTFQHAVLGNVPLVGSFFNVSAGPTSGGSETPQANSFRTFGESYQVVFGPGYRQIIDVGNWEAGLAIISVGQSGHPFHPHYGDMAPLWRDMRYVPLRWSETSVDTQNDVLVLVPGAFDRP